MAHFDRTKVAIDRQLRAFKVDSFEVGLYNREKDKMLPRIWSRYEIIKAIPWLKVMNTKGHDIFIRPEGSQGLVFFDDLNYGILERMSADGFEPAIVIESSPMNFHGWVRVSDRPISTELATCVCKVLAARYNGDTDSADWRHYGRLAGFTNRKPKYIDEMGKQPFVLLNKHNGRLATNSNMLLELGEKELARRKAELNERRQKIAAQGIADNLPDAQKYYRSQLAGLQKRYGTQLDYSRADWMIINKMINLGYNESSLRAVLIDSPALDTRTNHIDIYIDTTLNNALGR